MKIAFQTYTGEDWLGGITTIRDLLIALRRLGSEAPTCLLAAWEYMDDSYYRAYVPLVDGTFRVPQPQPPAPAHGLRQKFTTRWRNLTGQPAVNANGNALNGKLRAKGIDCTFSVVLGEDRHDTTVPLIIWFYDFQYRNLPQLFTPDEIQDRSEVFQREGQLATLLLVQSDSVKSDVARFLPEFAAKTRRLRWVADIPASIYEKLPSEALQAYHLPEQFFYMPNQFWMHKNHLAVFKALRILRERGVRPTIVCSGSLVDSRRLDYINDLMRSLSEWDVREQVIFLGVVPRDHVLMLMRQSVSVINASLFEGFGLSVAECLSLGKGMVLSDLPVLREQAAPACRYFDPHDEADLASALAAVWATTPPGPDHQLESEARAALANRQIEFGRAFLQIVTEAVEIGRRHASAEPRQRR